MTGVERLTLRDSLRSSFRH